MNTLLNHTTNFNQLIATILLLAFVVLLQKGGTRWILSRKFHSNTYRTRWIVGLRNLRLLILVLGLILIWATELRTAALSAVAILAALVIGTKELIMCLLGSILKTGSNAFSVGDRIRINQLEGDVIDQTLLSTQLQEIRDGQHTGERISFPNSLFLSQAVHNCSLFDSNTSFGILNITLPREVDWAKHEQALLNAADNYCSKSSERIQKIVDKLRKNGALLPDTRPRSLIKLTDKDSLTLSLRYPTTIEAKLSAEQEILRNYLQAVQAFSSERADDVA